MANYYNAGAVLQGINAALGPLMEQRMQDEALRKQLKLKQQMDLENALRELDMKKQLALWEQGQKQAGLTQAHTQARQMMTPLQGLPPINQMGSNVYAGQGFPISPFQTGGIYPNMPAGFQPKSYNPFATKSEDILSLERMPLSAPPDYLGQRKKLADIAKTEVETEKIRKEQPSAKDTGTEAAWKAFVEGKATDEQKKLIGALVTEPKEKQPTWGQEQNVASVKSGLKSGKGTVRGDFGKIETIDLKTSQDALNYIIQENLDPALFAEELKLYEPVTIKDKQGKIIGMIPRRILAEALKQGYTEVK